MLRLTLTLSALLLTLLVGNPAFSTDFQKGLDAYKSGDYATALREWKPLAEQGHADAQSNLGVMYDKGKGVPQNDKTAVKWWKLAAEQGDVRAQSNLDWMYGNGNGVVQDYVRAHMWWNIAASQGDKDATKNKDIIAERMTPSQLEKAQRLARECVKKNYKGLLDDSPNDRQVALTQRWQVQRRGLRRD